MSRKVNLHQGTIINNRPTLERLGFDNSVDAAIVISHDCDIANEELVEIIAGKITEKPNHSFSYNKNPRCLHLGLGSDEERFIILEQANKRLIAKEELEAASNGPNQTITDDNKRILREWLAARYARPAFPDSFENRLRKKTAGSNKIIDKIRSIMAKYSIHIEGLYFDLGEHGNDELAPDEEYCLTIYVVYHARYLPDAKNEATKIADKLKELFANTSGIILEQCMPISDSDFSLAHLQRTRKWRLEYITNQDLAKK